MVTDMTTYTHQFLNMDTMSNETISFTHIEVDENGYAVGVNSEGRGYSVDQLGEEGAAEAMFAFDGKGFGSRQTLINGELVTTSLVKIIDKKGDVYVRTY